jgi:hypothetical protein
MKRYILPLLIAFLLAGASLSLPSRGTELRDARFGYPFAFILQDQSGRDPPVPGAVSIASPWENPTKVQWVALSLDVVFLWAFAWGSAWWMGRKVGRERLLVL